MGEDYSRTITEFNNSFATASACRASLFERRLPNVKDFIATGGVVHTDGWRGHGSLGTQGYTHEVTVLKRSKWQATELLPRVLQVVPLLKR
jgi:hypothetical protein